MLADLNEVFQVANEKKIAIGAFNVVNFEHIQAILEAAEKLNMPTILAFAQTHEENLEMTKKAVTLAKKYGGNNRS